MRVTMRRAWRSVISWRWRVLVLAFITCSAVISRSNLQLAYADHQTPFFTSEGFQPVGIDFGFRLNVPSVPNEPRMYITRPETGNPRQLQQRDADASEFSLRATLSARSVSAFDNLAVIPAVLGTQGGQVTAGGFTTNDILVTQGRKVFLVSGAGTGAVTPTLLTTLPSEGTPFTQCSSPNSRIVVDRWNLQFGGRAVLTCTGFGSEEEELTEIWLIGQSGTTANVTKFKTLNFRATGRIAITSPNFSGCGGCLALVADGTALNVTLIKGDGTVDTIAAGTASSGPQNAITVPARVYRFGSSGGCLFGTRTPSSQDTILKFPCTAPSPLTVFDNTSAGDLLIFTNSATVVRVKASDRTVMQVHSSAGKYHDLAFSPLRRVKMEVVQPSSPRGHIVFRLFSSPGFDPTTDVDVSSLEFGRNGDEASVDIDKCHAIGINGHSTLQCLADARMADCPAPFHCIVTGFTVNQTGFDGGG